MGPEPRPSVAGVAPGPAATRKERKRRVLWGLGRSQSLEGVGGTDRAAGGGSEGPSCPRVTAAIGAGTPHIPLRAGWRGPCLLGGPADWRFSVVLSPSHRVIGREAPSGPVEH
ncbi:hypothetical protein NDU88_000556 [Pleurodeles waltl]|uniref:Uncharacterized protein n=1 Tax=Pleurodeles waltl TaxID=8319 RepID=A0AAV7U419_PLEWA|nr:hypothetical protein NDU88_000556 [Pleurodeles waltl]